MIERGEERLKDLEHDDDDHEEDLITSILRKEENTTASVILKAGTAGALETVLQQAAPVLANCPDVQIVDSGIGPFNEADVITAEQTNSVLIGFDVPVNDAVE